MIEFGGGEAQAISISATDIDNPGSELTFTVKNAGCSSASPLPTDLVLTASSGTGAGTLAGPGSRSATISGIYNVAPNTYLRCIEVSDGSATASKTLTVVVTQEDAQATYTGDMFAFVPSGSNSVTVVLRATIQDITAYNPNASPPNPDTFAGDIRKAKVTFSVPGVSLPSSCTGIDVALIDSDSKTGSVYCFATLSLSSSQTSNSFDVLVTVSNYYTTGTTGTVTIGEVTITRPDGSFLTGGGYIVPMYSSGVYASDPGSNTNFGFNVKYNKGKNSNPQGHVNIIFRRTVGGVVRTYQIKSSAIDTFGTSYQGSTGSCSGPPSPSCWAVGEFRSKANLTDVTNPLSPIALGGNYTLQIKVTDKGEPGAYDSIAVALWNDSILLHSSWWSGTTTLERLLAGGNLVAH